MHCARAVHVQITYYLLPFPAPTGQTVGTADARRAGYMYAATTYVFLWLPFLYGAACACQDQKSLFDRGPPVLEKFEPSTPIGTLMEFDERNSMVHVIL